ncbi:MAG: heparan-alpha-glucosaminide N-acetyltransferase domain-containing protein, partial [Bacteroidota bacterium]
GISVSLSGTRRSKRQLSLFLIKRGLWLIALELVITFAITLDPFYHLFIFQVIGVIGASMIILGFLIWLPLYAIAAIGIVILFGHDILMLVKLPDEGVSGFLWKFLFTAVALFHKINDSHSLLVLYTVMPWLGVMLCGYCIGQLYHSSFDAVKRKKILFASGISLVVLFFVLRAFNIYGDPSPWATQKTTALSVISFFNVSKYPPSLLFLCMTIGPGLIFLSGIEKVTNWFTRLLTVYGNVPLFYFVLHIYLLRLLNVMLFYVQGYGTQDIITPKSIMLFRPVEYGVNLLGVYGVWLLVIAIMYFPCRWFSVYKKTHHQWWLSYL